MKLTHEMARIKRKTDKVIKFKFGVRFLVRYVNDAYS